MRIFLLVLLLVALGVASQPPPRGRNQDFFEPDILPPELQADQCAVRESCYQNGELTWSNTTELKSINIYLRNCFCDPLCWAYGDCCEDVVDMVSSDENPWSSNIPTRLDQDTFVCTSSSIKRMVIKTDLFLVIGCPADWEDEAVRENCEKPPPSDLFLNIPVTDADGVIYQNMFCALCHEAEDTTFWQVSVACNMELPNVSSEDLEGILTKQLDAGLCTTLFQPPVSPIEFRPCKKLVNSCPDTWPEASLKLLCEDGGHRYVYQPMMVGTRPFKNEACAQCNNITDAVCIDYPAFVIRSEKGFLYPLSFILDINTKSGDSTGYGISGRMFKDDFNETVGNTQSCDDNHVYDVFKEKCRPLWCPEGYNLIDEQCSPAANSTQMACPMIRLNSTEFAILPGSDLYVNDTGDIHAYGTYLLQDDGSVFICTNFTKDYLNETIPLKFSSAQTILSVIGQVISIICLIVHLAVYSMFRKLRNLAGMNIMCLSGCLLIAQLLFLFAGSASTSFPLCFTIGVLVHYFFLASFLWMNVMAFDICRTFVKFSKPSARDNFLPKFIRYCAYCFLTALVIVLTGVVVNFTLVDSLYRPGYGEGVCWIRYRKALIIFFAVPVAIIVASNLVYFAVTLYCIQKAMESSKMATVNNNNNNNNNRDRFWLYVKLSTIMGLTWVFGFVAAIFDVEPLWYVFIIFNSLQGAMICAAFVLTKQVLGLLRGKFRKEPSSETEMATRSTALSKSNPSSDAASSRLLQKH